MRKAFRWLIFAVVLVAGAAYAYTGYVVHQHRQAVLAKLKDPDSAKFQRERLRYGYTLSTSVLCGEVNAKNETGGYTGYRRFIASGHKMYVEVADNDVQSESVKIECGE